MKRRHVVLGAVGAALAGLGAFLVATRKTTRLRLAYPPGEVTTTKNVVYVAGSANPKHRLDVYAPAGAKDAPVVHFIHGGYWTEGDKDFFAPATALYGSIGVALAKRGIVTVVQSYRLAPEVAIDGITDDVFAALAWTLAHAHEHGGDPRRVVVMGHSAGGHLASLVGTSNALHAKHGRKMSDVRGVVALSAVWDLEGMHDAHDAAWNERVTFRVFGKDRARWKAWSPFSIAEAGGPAFLVLVGENDFPYMIPQSERATLRLVDLGRDARRVVIPGNDHAAMVLKFGASDDDVSGPVADFVKSLK